MKRFRRFVLVLPLMTCAATLPEPSRAWLIVEPGQDAPEFRDANQTAADLLSFVSVLFERLAQAERSLSNVDLPDTGILRNAAGSLQSLGAQISNSRPLNFDTPQGAFFLQNFQRFGIQAPPNTSIEVYIFMAAEVNALADAIDRLRGDGFGPSQSTDFQKRQTFSEVMDRIYRVFVLGSYLASILQS
jgi:hypothetical protein